MKIEKGKISDIYELKTLSSMSKVQRFRLTTEVGINLFFNLFNNVELLSKRKVGDYVAVQYNEKQNGQFTNNYVNNLITYNPDAVKPKAIAGIAPKYRELMEGEKDTPSKYF